MIKDQTYPAIGRELGLPCTTVYDCLLDAGMPHNALSEWWPVILVVIGVAILNRPRRSK
jgi:hypothetical protein